jgi:hypothetical protein
MILEVQIFRVIAGGEATVTIAFQTFYPGDFHGPQKAQKKASLAREAF